MVLMKLLNKFFGWFDNQTMMVRLIIMFFTFYNAFYLGRVIRVYLL